MRDADRTDPSGVAIMNEQQATPNQVVNGQQGSNQPQDKRKRSDQKTTTLFRWTDDPFINEAAAEVGRQLKNQDHIKIHPTRIEFVHGLDITDLMTRIERIFRHALENTHRRNHVAHQINGAVETVGKGSDDERWVPPPDRQFPDRSDEDLTLYPDDEVDVDILEQNGIPVDQVDYVDDDSSSLYHHSPTFVGHPAGDKFEDQLNRFERYLDIYLATLEDSFDGDDTSCMLCGSTAMPAYKGVEGNFLEFNQSFDILSTTSGVSVPLGMGSRDSKHRGRCVACLLAGFYYTLMPKIVRFKDREPCGGNFPIPVYRVFTPQGDFTELVEIRGDFETDLLAWIDKPTTNDHARRGTLPAVSTPSRGLQTLQFYEAVLRYVNREYTNDHYEFSVEYRPTALVSYTSTRKKSGQPIRGIREMEAIDPDEWAYGAVRQRTIPTSNGNNEDEQSTSYWPVEDLLTWYVRLDDVSTKVLDDIGYGILRQDLKRLERGHFEVAKAIERNQGTNAPYILPIKRAAHYVTTIMQQAVDGTTERIDEEAIESIKRVASNVGETFYERDDISVLISLQNASTSDEFLEAFEKASMQAQKKASAENGSSSWSGQNDIAQVLKLINDPDTFHPAKRMFVIHASLSAQYINAQQAEGGD
jgi:hypothetical protein